MIAIGIRTNAIEMVYGVSICGSMFPFSFERSIDGQPVHPDHLPVDTVVLHCSFESN